MLNRRGRIIITVVSLSALIIILDCIIGFTMGGFFTVKHWLVVIPINAVLSLLSILFINGKEYIKSKKMLERLFLLLFYWLRQAVFLCSDWCGSGRIVKAFNTIR